MGVALARLAVRLRHGGGGASCGGSWQPQQLERGLAGRGPPLTPALHWPRPTPPPPARRPRPAPQGGGERCGAREVLCAGERPPHAAARVPAVEDQRLPRRLVQPPLPAGGCCWGPALPLPPLFRLCLVPTALHACPARCTVPMRAAQSVPGAPPVIQLQRERVLAAVPPLHSSDLPAQPSHCLLGATPDCLPCPTAAQGAEEGQGSAHPATGHHAAAQGAHCQRRHRLGHRAQGGSSGLGAGRCPVDAGSCGPGVGGGCLVGLPWGACCARSLPSGAARPACLLGGMPGGMREAA